MGRVRPGPVYWLEQAVEDERERAVAACPALAGTVRADVCIVGGGYTGLWAALELTEQAPDATVVVVEAGACGFGASGRNGGWVTSWMDELEGLSERFGDADALWLADESSATIGRIEGFIGANGIDCHFRRRGTLWVASAEPQLAVVREAATAARRLGRGNVVEELSAADAAARAGSSVVLGGVLVGDGAAVQPALLARGLRRVALQRGVRIFEGSPMIRLERDAPAAVVTSAGRVEAGQVVLATNAWAAAQARELRRTVAVVGSQIVLTEPVAPERLAAV